MFQGSMVAMVTPMHDDGSVDNAALEKLVATIDQISLERAVPATMSVWRAALEAVEGPEQKRLF